jgi:hypothetical protein
MAGSGMRSECNSRSSSARHTRPSLDQQARLPPARKQQQHSASQDRQHVSGKHRARLACRSGAMQTLQKSSTCGASGAPPLTMKRTLRGEVPMRHQGRGCRVRMGERQNQCAPTQAGEWRDGPLHAGARLPLTCRPAPA